MVSPFLSVTTTYTKSDKLMRKRSLFQNNGIGNRPEGERFMAQQNQTKQPSQPKGSTIISPFQSLSHSGRQSSGHDLVHKISPWLVKCRAPWFIAPQGCKRKVILKPELRTSERRRGCTRRGHARHHLFGGSSGAAYHCPPFFILRSYLSCIVLYHFR